MTITHKIIIFFTGLSMVFFMTASASAYEFPPYRGIALKITSDITGNYSNNVTFASDKESKIEDFRTMLNLGLNFQYSSQRRVLGFSGLMKRQIYNTASNIRNPSENVAVSYLEALTKYDSISLRNTFTHTQEPGSATGDFDMENCRDYYVGFGYSTTEIESICNEFNEEFGRYKGRFDSYSNNFSFNYNKTLSEAFDFSVNYGFVQNWSDVYGTNDSDSNIFGLLTTYKHSAATSFSLKYDYQISSFGRGSDISQQSVNAGIGQYITKKHYFNANLGQTKVSSGSNSMTAGATFKSEIDEKTSASLSYSQGVQINTNTNDTFENWQVKGSLSRKLLEDLKSSLTAFYGKGDYSSSSITDTLLGASAKLSYKFWQSKRGSSMHGSLGYSYSDLASTDAGREYTRNSINTSLVVAF